MITFRPLKRMLVEKNCSIGAMVSKCGMSSEIAWKISKNLNVNMIVIGKICEYFNCQPSDVISYLEDDDADI